MFWFLVEIRDEKSQNDLSASENKENILEKENAKQEDADTTDALSEKGSKVKEELQKHSETAKRHYWIDQRRATG